MKPDIEYLGWAFAFAYGILLVYNGWLELQWRRLVSREEKERT